MIANLSDAMAEIGRMVHQIAALEQRAREAEEEVADWREGAEKAAAEPCGDEKHCACVPLLRKEAERLRGLAGQLWHRLETPEWERGDWPGSLYDDGCDAYEQSHAADAGERE